MKRIFQRLALLLLGLGIVALMMPVSVNAQNPVWQPVEKGQWKTMAWDAVTALTDGDPIPDPADAAMSYNVYVRNRVTNAVIPIASGITALQLEIILPKRGDYYGGVEASLLYTGGTAPIKSTISWSDIAANCQGGVTFGFRFQTAPGQAKGLR